jgi:hypothetical protein
MAKWMSLYPLRASKARFQAEIAHAPDPISSWKVADQLFPATS